MEPLVSLIVPVYNAAATLPRCLDSLLQQRVTSLQIILVNDGSTDDSLRICRAYQARDARIAVLDLPNRGVSSARNSGIACASGRYLMFADSDDWLAPDAVERMVRAAEQTRSDLVICDFYRVKGSRMQIKGSISDPGVLSRRDFARSMMNSPADFYYGVMWNKLYRRELIARYQMQLDSRVQWCEDLLFNLQYLSKVQTVCVCKLPLYYYVSSPNSLAKRNATLRNWLRMKRMVYEKYCRLFEELGMHDRPADILRVARFLLAVARDGGVRRVRVRRRVRPKAGARRLRRPAQHREEESCEDPDPVV